MPDDVPPEGVPATPPSVAKLILLNLANRADADGRCWPSVARIAGESLLSVRTVQRALGMLERVGLIVREARAGSSTCYVVTLPDMDDSFSPPSACRPSHGDTPDTGDRGGVTLVSPRTFTEPKEERTFLRKDAPATAVTPTPMPAEPFNARKAVWSEGVATVQRLTGKPTGAARKLVGLMLKAARDDCAGVLIAIRECPDTRDPLSWLVAAAKARGTTKRSSTEAIREEWNLPTFADPSLLDNFRSR